MAAIDLQHHAADLGLVGNLQRRTGTSAIACVAADSGSADQAESPWLMITPGHVGHGAAGRRPGFDQLQFQVQQLERHGPQPGCFVRGRERRIGFEAQPARPRGHGGVDQQPQLVRANRRIGRRRRAKAASIVRAVAAQAGSESRVQNGVPGRASRGRSRTQVRKSASSKLVPSGMRRMTSTSMARL